ncbi:MAG TPA: helix-turn-helix domain-containing protein [Phycisphaerae bacterium]|nr:helix-turn-helix domain-containing protein [Phycisphaerae bacterium]HOM53595.1 helix-turn-helix domain-containing protein [Phycisphaerae bacterium]HPP28953.1 helix-turn-helix domain-containing protein [Phycisphaerae bacterium]HQA00538.1 helix-turn-helix domain-containing protein [Phycisphaerae bacterium]HQE28011.1 helix-turn-helix domain-containing protein [Phycisphaerae bacterium]
MDMPSYDGVIERWKVDLIITRAKLLKFRAYQLPDVLQELVLELLDFEYDPEHADGATESTALTTVIDHHLRKMKRSAKRYQARLERMGEEVSEFSPDEVDMQAIDVGSIVAGLPPREQAVCQGLAGGMTRQEIARELGCGWHTVNRIVKQLREHFRETGLAGWVGE